MPYTIEQRGDEWCVIKESDGKSMGCHASRSRAVAQQRALYANEPSLSASTENGQPPVKIEFSSVKEDVAPALIASIEAITERLKRNEEALRHVTDTMERIAETIVADREELTRVLTAAVQAPPAQPPVVNVTVPEQPAPHVEVNVPELSQPDVHVVVEAQPSKPRKVVFERDPLTGSVSKAEISEE
jgi:hypothetical protein